MSREACFCGWEGETEDREPDYLDDGLACPNCGHLDRLADWQEAARRWILAEAALQRDNAAKSSATVAMVAQL